MLFGYLFCRTLIGVDRSALLTHSCSGRAIAVKRVTENQGRNTPGVDKVTWKTSGQRPTRFLTQQWTIAWIPAGTNAWPRSWSSTQMTRTHDDERTSATNSAPRPR
ncbi:reverse transcriptase N-terminal domain-containing protein [Paraburkholderia silvatlantica]|uniref:reverse transcriptase N-terminal domain-containing protein n=1 Tax=Paraburkholderia silvatlantica TaxID=321895 RepID=UPI000D75EF4B